jgi:hypothetical protein
MEKNDIHCMSKLQNMELYNWQWRLLCKLNLNYSFLIRSLHVVTPGIFFSEIYISTPLSHHLLNEFVPASSQRISCQGNHPKK